MRKLVVLLLFIIASLFGSAQVDGFPQYEFKSTSSYQYTTPQRQYTVPVAVYDLQGPSSPAPRRVVMSEDNPGYDPADPRWENVPVGDPPFILILITATVYIFIHRKRKTVADFLFLYRYETNKRIHIREIKAYKGQFQT